MWLYLFLACSLIQEQEKQYDSGREEIFWSPDQEGPFDAGLHSFSFVTERGRELFVDVWYPAQRRELDNLATYEPFSFKGRAYRDAPVAQKENALIAFSHGLMSVRFQNSSLCEHLAQHGYVVIAPDHPGTHIFNLTDDVSAVDVFARPEDIQSTVDQFLQKTQDSADPMYQMVSSEQYIAIGHSLGTHTVMALGGATYDYEGFMAYCTENPDERACKIGADISQEAVLSFRTEDPRVYATIPMSPGFWYIFQEGLAELRNPFFVTGQRDHVLEYDTEAIPTMEYAPQTAPELHYPNTGHYGFTEMCSLIPAFSDECTATEGEYTDPGFLLTSLQSVLLAHIKGNIEGEDRYRDWLKEQDWPADMLIYREGEAY